jgi:hypothetical protein
MALDLSRPGHENSKPLEGLGIYDFSSDQYRLRNEYYPGPREIDFGNGHQRSVSNTSAKSMSSGLQRPSAPLVPSVIREPARSFSPPVVSKSTPASLHGSEEDADVPTPTADRPERVTLENYLREDELPSHYPWLEAALRGEQYSSKSASSSPGRLRLLTSGSASRLGSYSQTSLSLTSPVLSSKGRNATEAAASPSTRTSLDKALGFIHPRRESPLDPEDRATAIRDARRAYIIKQESKARKAKAEAEKAKEEKRKEGRRATFEDPFFPAAVFDDRTAGFVGGAGHHEPGREEEKKWEKGEFAGVPGVRRSSTAKGRWMRFVLWFQTRVFKIKQGLKRIV